MLNTNWGDWGNPCSMELGMYGLVLGAAKAWSVDTSVDEDFYDAVNHLLYNGEDGIGCLKTLCKMHRHIVWRDFVRNYHHLKAGEPLEFTTITAQAVREIQKRYLQLKEALQTPWAQDSYRKEILCAAEALCVVAELTAKMDGMEISRITDTEKFNPWSFIAIWVAVALFFGALLLVLCLGLLVYTLIRRGLAHKTPTAPQDTPDTAETDPDPIPDNNNHT
jgi:hypothetical protein